MAESKHILVVANETVGGRKLIEAVKRRADEGPAKFTVVCPQNLPKAGLVVYRESVQDAARRRLEMTLAQLREVGVEAEGEVMDPDPFLAIADALRIYQPDEIIISTHPETRSGWLRRGLVERVQKHAGVPVEHVVVDLEADREHMRHLLVVANQTVGGRKLIHAIEQRAEEGPIHVTVICPQNKVDEGNSWDAARRRLEATLAELHRAGIEADGQVMHPDPYTSVQNALQYYNVDEIIISTFPKSRSGWVRGDLVDRVRRLTLAPVEHIVVDPEEQSSGAAAGEKPARIG